MGTVADERPARRGARRAPSAAGRPGPARAHRGAVLALAGLVVLVAAGLWTQAVQVHLWTQDEEYFVQLSRLLSENLPKGLWDLPVNAFDERGPQRLTILLLSWPLSVVNGEAGQRIARAVQCLAWASAAIPAYLIMARTLGSRLWGFAAAAATVLVPWAVLTGTYLTEPVAYPAALWALYGAWRACVVPGWRSDLLAIALALLAGLARTNLLVLGVVAPAALVVHTLSFAGVRRAPGVLWREHPIYAVLLVPGAIVLFMIVAGIHPGPLGTLAGSYVTSFDQVNPAVLPGKWRGQLAPIVIGTGLVPAMLGVPWAIRQVIRPTARERSALAITCVIGFFVVLVSTLYAASEERYLMVAAPFILLPGIVAMVRGELPVWAAALGVLAVSALVGLGNWAFVSDQSMMLVNPATSFWGRTVVPRAPHIGGDANLGAGLGVLLLGCLALVALALRGRGRGRGPGGSGGVRIRRAALAAVVAVLALVGVLQAAQTGYIVHKRTMLASDVGSLEDWTWVDDAVGSSTVGISAEAVGNSPEYGPVWRDVTFWNRRVTVIDSTAPNTLQIPRYGVARQLEVNAKTGRVRALDGSEIPGYQLVPTLFTELGWVGRVVERSSYLAVELVRLSGTPRAAWRWSGTEPDGFLGAGQSPAKLTVYRPAFQTRARRCIAVTIGAPAAPGVRHFTVRSASRVRRGALKPAEQARVVVPVGRRGVVRLSATGARNIGDGRKASVRVIATELRRCS